MLNLALFSSAYFIILYSVLGFGLFFEKFFYKKNNKNNLGYVGLLGIFFLINANLHFLLIDLLSSI